MSTALNYIQGRGNGYLADFSKSVNARIAERMGKRSLMQAAKALRCSEDAVLELVEPCEVHHVGKKFKVTPYYDIDLLLKVRDNQDTSKYGLYDIDNALITLNNLKNFRKSPKSAK